MASPRGGSQACNKFKRGQCIRGNKCKYSHDISSPGPSGAPGPSFNTSVNGLRPSDAPQNTPRPRGRRNTRGTTKQAAQRPGARENTHTPGDKSESAYRSWRRSLGGEGASPDLTATEMESFLREAVAILGTGSAGVKQSLVKDLGSERGLRRIRQIVESDFTMAFSITEPGFHRHCVAFLKLVSHEEIQSSLALRADIGTIYNVIYGPGGSRGINFFQKVCEKLLQARAFEDALVATAATLLNTIKLNQSAAVRPEFKTIFQHLQTCYNQGESQHSSFPLRSAHLDIERIRERLHMGELMSSVQSTALDPNSFRQAVDLPGLRSRLGKRHDNDFEFIKYIKILPTTNEIMSDRDPFLPLKGVRSEHHLQGIQRLLDSQFRLLREDTVGQLRDSVRYLLNNWKVLVKSTDKEVKKHVQRGSQIRLRTYGGAKVERLRYDRGKGLAIDVSFDQPKEVAGLSKGERVKWWEGCGELADGSLLGLIDEAKETTFLLVSTRTVDTENPDSRPQCDLDDLASNGSRALITLSLTDPNNAGDQSRVTSLARGQASGLIMVEFIGTLLISFEPVLKILQKLQVNPNLPFAKWIIPQPPKSEPGMQPTLGARSGSTVKVPPPLYLVRNKILLDLSCISKDGQKLSFSIDKPLTLQELEQRTTLNHGQCKAMITGLQNELALIQGPPGTGKSYVGLRLVKVILANRDQTKIGPIVCVCNTEYALDRLLEDLLEDGVEEVVHLGSRSKNPKIKNRTLQVINKGADQTKPEELEVKRCNQALEIVQDNMVEVCDFISKPDSWKKLKSHLETSYPHYYKALYGVSGGDGWTEVNSWLLGRSTQDAERAPPRTNRSVRRLLGASQHTSIWSMSLRERAVLKRHWEKEIRDSMKYKLQEALKSHTEINNTLKQQYRESDKRCLEKAHVIGVTITGLATNSELLRGLLPKVLICEDAAEVLEAHVLTALLPSVQHAILIGDHLQLRPQVSSYHLSVDSERGGGYDLGESLFERLANERFDNGEKFPTARLDIQRRMHPTISSLLRETLYPELQDHDDTRLFEEVVGMQKRLFWLDHRNLEDSAGDDESGSKTNEWEIDMVMALVKHLTRQGVYGPNDIAVLTPYSGQSQKLKARLESSCELVVGGKDSEKSPKVPSQDVQKGRLFDAVRVSTVDKFQGDQAKVIIISLVRSNTEGSCGFLRTSNHIKALLSRARHGLYIIGNAVTACSKVPMWTKVTKLLEDGGNIGTAFPLRCVRHPNNRMFVATPEDFLVKSPEGGCSKKCGLRLSCGHTCISKCHPEPFHRAMNSIKPCIRKFPACGRCTVGVANVQLLCGHVAPSLSCFDALNLGRVRCSQTVTKKMPLCGHETRVACHTDISKTQCTAICGENLPCGHQCNKECWNCKKSDDKGDVGVDHGACENVCGRSFITCNHGCPKVCHGGGPCSPCVRPCEIRCSHSKCPKKCSESCPPCAEQCTWSCVHRGRCTMPCAVPCNIIPCSKRCGKNLGCGHRCPGICGEACPKVEFCKECAIPEILERTVDPNIYNAYKDVDLNEDPILFLTCGHFYTISSLDRIMGLKEAYIDKEGKILGPKPASRVHSGKPPRIHSGKPPKGCPECRSPLRDIHRYNRVVKLVLLDEAARRFIESAYEMYMGLLDRVFKAEKDLEGERTTFTTANQNTGNSDHARISQALEQYKRKGQAILSELNAFTKVMARSEQPFDKVNSLVISAKRQRNITTSLEFDKATIQTGFQYRGQLLSLRLNWAVLWDWNTICNDLNVDTYIRDKLHSDIMNQVKTLKTCCITLKHSSNQTNLPLHGVEARVYHAQFVALELSHQLKDSGPPVTGEYSRGATIAAARRAETESLEECERIRTLLPGTTAHLKADITKALGLLNGATFYNFVITEEQQEIYRAMASQSRGTDHLYYCANYPLKFTPGGRNHVPTTRVRVAADLEGRFAGTTTTNRARAQAPVRALAAPWAPAVAPRRAPAATSRVPPAPRVPAAVQIPAATRAPAAAARVQVVAQAVPVVARAPVAAQGPVPTRDPIVAQVPAVTQTPVVAQTPAEAPVIPDPIVAQVPTVTKIPTEAHVLVSARAPIAPARARGPIMVQVPVVAQITAEAHVPVATRALVVPARVRDPIVAQAPAVAQIPAEARVPVAVGTPTTTQVPITYRAPIVAQIAAPEVRDPVAQALAAARASVVTRVPVPAVARVLVPGQGSAADRVSVAAQTSASTRTSFAVQTPARTHQAMAREATDFQSRFTRIATAAAARDAARAAAQPLVADQFLPWVPGQRSAADRVSVAAQTSASTLTSFAAQTPVGTHQAMARQSWGTSYWFCENNHPFAVGERGIPMELARCPECGAERDSVATSGARGATGLRNRSTRIATAIRAPVAERPGLLAGLLNFMRFKSPSNRNLQRE